MSKLDFKSYLSYRQYHAYPTQSVCYYIPLVLAINSSSANAMGDILLLKCNCMTRPSPFLPSLNSCSQFQVETLYQPTGQQIRPQTHDVFSGSACPSKLDPGYELVKLNQSKNMDTSILLRTTTTFPGKRKSKVKLD